MKWTEIIEDLIDLYEAGYNNASLSCRLRDHLAPKDRALAKAEAFIAGFEDDELQEGIPQLLAEIRHAVG